ncbi:hypothetical protein [Dongia sp.]|uniref:hypothetical protein n=1 Tax=Dongia sp. TaxID=1977262 RepID=UPI0037512607
MDKSVEQQIAELEGALEQLKRIVFKGELSDREVKSKLVVLNAGARLADGRHIATGKTTGSSFGSATTDKISFYGKPSITQPGAIASPAGGATVDSEARTAIDAIRLALKNLGATA